MADRLHELTAAAIARCEARAAALRALPAGPLVLMLDALPPRDPFAPDVDLNSARDLSGLNSARNRFRVTSRQYRFRHVHEPPRVDWARECERQAMRYGRVTLCGGADQDTDEGIAYMLRLVDGGLYEHDEGANDPYGGANTWNLLDYGALLDALPDRATLAICAPDCSNRHYYEVGHALYRRAVERYGTLHRRARRYERFASPQPGTVEWSRACYGRNQSRVRHSAKGREVLRQARADSLAQGSAA